MKDKPRVSNHNLVAWNEIRRWKELDENGREIIKAESHNPRYEIDGVEVNKEEFIKVLKEDIGEV
jgi:hypothetical protein